MAATSPSEAATVLKISRYTLSKWGAVTGNTHEIEAAMAHPRTVVMSPRQM